MSEILVRLGTGSVPTEDRYDVQRVAVPQQHGDLQAGKWPCAHRLLVTCPGYQGSSPLIQQSGVVTNLLQHSQCSQGGASLVQGCPHSSGLQKGLNVLKYRCQLINMSVGHDMTSGRTS